MINLLGKRIRFKHRYTLNKNSLPSEWSKYFTITLRNIENVIFSIQSNNEYEIENDNKIKIIV